MKMATQALAMAGFVTLVGGAVFLFKDPMHFRTSSLVAACEDALKSQLRSPSGYSRVSVTELRPAEASLEEVMGWAEGTDKRAADLSMALRDPSYAELLHIKIQEFEVGAWVHAASIEYDAPNGFNAMIRDRVECSIISANEASIGTAYSFDVRIDGMTGLDRSLVALRAAEGRTATISKAEANRAMALIQADPPPPLSDDECAWLVDGWNAEKSVEAMKRYGAETAKLRAQCKKRPTK